MKTEINDVWSAKVVKPTVDEAGLPLDTPEAAFQRLHDLLERGGQLASQQHYRVTSHNDHHYGAGK